MFSRDKDKLALAKGMMLLSISAAILAGLGSIGYDIYLASTQWMLVAVLLAVWSVYCLAEAQFRLKR
jgi:hypothetical protein